jgi:hypothetical protein
MTCWIKRATCRESHRKLLAAAECSEYRTRPRPHDLGRGDAGERVPGADVIAAFNNVPSEVLFGVFEARGKADRPSLVYCGDKRPAKHRCHADS